MALMYSTAYFKMVCKKIRVQLLFYKKIKLDFGEIKNSPQKFQKEIGCNQFHEKCEK